MVNERGTNRIIIAGAGPLGTALAHVLCHSDISVRLVEALPAPEIACRGASDPPSADGSSEIVSVPEQTDDELLSPGAVEACLQEFCPRPGRHEIATIALYTVHQRVAAAFNHGRVLLAGDAAHVNTRSAAWP